MDDYESGRTFFFLSTTNSYFLSRKEMSMFLINILFVTRHSAALNLVTCCLLN